jgi:L-cysteine:1D-myo-inositol 2-amino-2-deoxy-alpha-D-glucopyranoside ligase
MLKLYNSLTQQKEEFKSFDPDGKLARLYVCGVTPYDTSHMGHALVAVVFDTLHRYLEYSGYTVTHIQNLTDVDDDIIKRARRDGVPYDELSRQWDKIYLDGLAAINCQPFDKYIAVSDVIENIKEMVAALVEKEAAYQANDGNVYFRASSFPQYGELAHMTPEQLMEKARAAAEDSLADKPGNPAKESELDFVLWQAAQAGEPSWDTPWGAGRPGWHIECSTISRLHLGDQFEIHGGGADLLFPHHSSEIAQTESVTGKAPSVRFWMHVAMLYLDGEKMSKSLGNLVLIRDALKTYSADAIRLYLLGAAHYRTPLHYEEEGVVRAEQQARLLTAALQNTPHGEGNPQSYADRFFDALDDDLNTPAAIETALGLATAILEGQMGVEGQSVLRQMTSVLGLSLANI